MLGNNLGKEKYNILNTCNDFFISLEVRPNMEVFHITLELSPSLYR